MPYTTQQIAELVDGTLAGPADLEVRSLAELDAAQPGQLTFIGSEQYADKWPASQASAALVSRSIELQPIEGRAVIAVDNADLAMAKVLAAFAPSTPKPAQGVHRSALVDPSAVLGPGVRVGPNCIVGPRAVISENTVLHANVCVYDDSTVGNDCEIWSGVVIRERCTLGDRCILHPNVVVGADGFGYRVDTSSGQPKVVKVPQIGTVKIGSDVELGAGTTIDRAKFDATVLGDGCKLDNLVQIGHNVRLGRMVVIAACCAVGGSCELGDGVMLGGQAAISDHIRVGAGAQIAGGSAVINDVPAGEKWGGMPAKLLKEKMREEIAVRKLPDLLRRLKKADLDI